MYSKHKLPNYKTALFCLYGEIHRTSQGMQFEPLRSPPRHQVLNVWKGVSHLRDKRHQLILHCWVIQFLSLLTIWEAWGTLWVTSSSLCSIFQFSEPIARSIGFENTLGKCQKCLRQGKNRCSSVSLACQRQGQEMTDRSIPIIQNTPEIRSCQWWLFSEH